MIAKMLLFASSYSPLLLLVGIRTDAGGARVAWLSSAALAAMALLVVLLASRGVSARHRVLVSLNDRGGDSAGYLATYLLPFLTVGDANARDIASYVLFIAIVGTIYVRSSLLSINPLVYLIGRKVVEVKSSDGRLLLLICRRDPPLGVPVKVRSILGGLAVLD